MNLYSINLWERAVAAHQAGEGSIRELAEVFHVVKNTIQKWLRRLRETGSVAPLPHGGGVAATIRGEDSTPSYPFRQPRSPDAYGAAILAYAWQTPSASWFAAPIASGRGPFGSGSAVASRGPVAPEEPHQTALSVQARILVRAVSSTGRFRASRILSSIFASPRTSPQIRSLPRIQLTKR